MIKMMLVDNRSAFDRIKLSDLAFNPAVCNIMTSRPLDVQVGSHASSLLSPLLRSLCTNVCTSVAVSNSTTIMKFADDTVVVGLPIQMLKRL